MGLIRDRAAAVDLVLPPAPKPAGLYVPLWYGAGRWRTSGLLSMDNGSVITGRAGAVTTEVAAHAARTALLNALAIVDAYLPAPEAETLCLTHLCGYVSAESGFAQGHLVMNAASEVVREILGQAGAHTREAIHVIGLPLGALVELRIEGVY